MPPNLENIHWLKTAVRELLQSAPYQTGVDASATVSHGLSQRNENEASQSWFYNWADVAEMFAGISMPASEGYVYVEDWLWKTQIEIFDQNHDDFSKLVANQNDLVIFSNDYKAGQITDATIHVVPDVRVEAEVEILVTTWGT